MFLLRAVFWLSIVVMLLPGDPERGTEAPRVGALEALIAARATIADLSGFCVRAPEACKTGGAALAALGEKARYGAGLLIRSLGSSLAESAAPLPTELRGTLTPDDRTPQWRPGGDV